ncbi:hypothetical protein FPRO04_09482 [Fusarium proliferatum]|nr:hypothetical protein FPRO04_09482 [Fusarium proliferatum]
MIPQNPHWICRCEDAHHSPELSQDSTSRLWRRYRTATVFQPLEATLREAPAVQLRMLEWFYVRSLCIENIKRHDIDGRKLAEKEGGPSAINNLFQQTCQEMEAAEAKTTEDGSSEMEQQ